MGKHYRQGRHGINAKRGTRELNGENPDMSITHTYIKRRHRERGTEDKDSRESNKQGTKLMISELRDVIRMNSELTS